MRSTEITPIATATQMIGRRAVAASHATHVSVRSSIGVPSLARARTRSTAVVASDAGSGRRVVTARHSTPTTANAPSSKIAGMRFTMSDPKPIAVVMTEMTSGTHTRSKARTTTSLRSESPSACS